MDDAEHVARADHLGSAGSLQVLRHGFPGGDPGLEPSRSEHEDASQELGRATSDSAALRHGPARPFALRIAPLEMLLAEAAVNRHAEDPADEPGISLPRALQILLAAPEHEAAAWLHLAQESRNQLRIARLGSTSEGHPRISPEQSVALQKLARERKHLGYAAGVNNCWEPCESVPKPFAVPGSSEADLQAIRSRTKGGDPQRARLDGEEAELRHGAGVNQRQNHVAQTFAEVLQGLRARGGHGCELRRGSKRKRDDILEQRTVLLLLGDIPDLRQDPQCPQQGCRIDGRMDGAELVEQASGKGLQQGRSDLRDGPNVQIPSADDRGKGVHGRQEDAGLLAGERLLQNHDEEREDLPVVLLLHLVRPAAHHPNTSTNQQPGRTENGCPALHSDPA
eukprot:scaffold3970_cov257-Pinguiococcus_pyrenoidosus.AAC.9